VKGVASGPWRSTNNAHLKVLTFNKLLSKQLMAG
jgi:hypothetical protein